MRRTSRSRLRLNPSSGRARFLVAVLFLISFPGLAHSNCARAEASCDTAHVGSVCLVQRGKFFYLNSCGFCDCFHSPLKMFQRKKNYRKYFFPKQIYSSVDILYTKIATPRSPIKIVSIYLKYLFRGEANVRMDVFDFTKSNKKRKLSSI